MITLDQKKQLQFDARIPYLPTDLTYECRMAISGEGSRAQDWSDKPHRLVYDLSRQVEADANRIEQLEANYIEACEEAAECYMRQCIAERKLTKAVEALQDMVAVAEQEGWDKAITGRQMIIKAARTVLAELEGKE